MKAILCLTMLLLMLPAGHPGAASTQSLSDDVVLARGNPPLTQSMVNKSIALLEWSLAVRFSSEDKSRIQQVLVNAWRSNNQAQIRSVLSVIEIYEQVSRMSPADRNNMRDRFRVTLLQNLRAEPGDELSRVVLDAYQTSLLDGQRPNSPGQNPPPGMNPGDEKHNGPAAPGKGGSTLPWRFSDGQAPLTLEEAEALLRQRPAADTAPAGAARPPGLSEALNSARSFLNKHASQKALAAFNSSAHARDGERAAAAAAGAMIYGRPLAALAALLRAHELQPQNAAHLAALSAVLSRMGMHQEALAILDSPVVMNGRLPSPLGMGGQAGALNTRGFALLQLGRARDAEDALRKAVARSPQLAEARANLAFALWAQEDQRKKDEAVRLLAAVWRRASRPAAKTVPGRTPPSRGPVSTVPGEIASELFAPGGNGTTSLDLSRGKRLRIPDLKIPATLEDAVAMHPKYQTLMQQVAGIQSALAARDDQLREAVTRRLQEDLEKAQNAADPLSAVNAVAARQKRFEEMEGLIDFETVKRHPSVRPFWEKARLARLNDYQGVNFEQQWLPGGMPAGVADRGSQSKQLVKKFQEWKEAELSEKRANLAQSAEIEKKYKRLRCAATREAHARWRSGIHDFDTAHREFLEAAYRHMTAVVANIAAPAEHELAQVGIERDIYTAWYEHILDTDSFFPMAERVLKFDCVEPTAEATGEDLPNIEPEKADRCPEALKGNNKAKVDLEVVEVSFNCEQIGVELSADVAWWVGLFTEVTVTFEGEVTITAGIKTDVGLVGVPGVGIPSDIGAKAGVFLKVGEGPDGWVIKDVGVSGEVSSSRGTGPLGIESSTGFEYSYLLTVGAPAHGPLR